MTREEYLKENYEMIEASLKDADEWTVLATPYGSFTKDDLNAFKIFDKRAHDNWDNMRSQRFESGS